MQRTFGIMLQSDCGIPEAQILTIGVRAARKFDKSGSREWIRNPINQ